MRRYSLLLLVAFVGMAGCDMLLPPNCTGSAISSLSITVLDSISGENLAPEAVVVLRYGTTVDTVRTRLENGAYFGPIERPGTYEITVTHPDYITWHRTGVEVEQGECHVITEELTARLMPDV